MKNLGKYGEDIITGFKGVITQKSFHVTGCVQYGIRGEAINNQIPHIHWFDVSRIKVGEVVFKSMQKND